MGWMVWRAASARPYRCISCDEGGSPAGPSAHPSTNALPINPPLPLIVATA